MHVIVGKVCVLIVLFMPLLIETQFIFHGNH